MKNIDSTGHTRGESIYLDDIPLLRGTLFGAVYGSPVAHGFIRRLDVSGAEETPGVVRVFTFQDIKGENQIGGIIPDEPLFAEHHVHFCGMPVAFVVAVSEDAARHAVEKIKVEIEPWPVVTDPRVAQANGELIVPPRTFRLGDVDQAWSLCEHVIEGRADTNGQEHLYIETQGAYAMPLENDVIRVYSSTQAPTAVQRAISKVTALPMHALDIEVTRLGGGFGGKEDQANVWAALCALACLHLKKPVKYAMPRTDDMVMTGKRHPYSSDFRIGVDKDLKILAYEVTFYQNAGAAADLSPAVLERTLFHCTNSYFIPNVRATAYSCRTNLPPNTAFRGFGGPQGMYVIEAAIAKVAEGLGVDAAVIQKKNLHRTGDIFPYGQLAESEAHACWQKAEDLYDIQSMRREVEAFNGSNRLFKKGIAFMPVCFGISFTKTLMNQARALVHVYTDGSVSLTTGAVEMGQGVNTKMLQVAAAVFSIDPGSVRIQATSTFKIANTSPSAASATADLNGKAVQMACVEILRRLKEVAAAELGVAVEDVEWREGMVWVSGAATELDWKKLVLAAFVRRVSLSEHAHYATPGIHFDPSKEKGHPFAYHVYGTAIVTVTLDCLRGRYVIDAVKVVHDFGTSMNPLIDRGQMEGGIVQGLGWMTMEEVIYDEKGRLRSNTLSTYKVPDIYSVPEEISIDFLHTQRDNLAIFRSKAVGEPPLMYGIGVYFALRQAIRAFNPSTDLPFSTPLTPEKVLMGLYDKKLEHVPG
ncbi:molybdopterin-dependent oxidoreductase [Flavitalea sp. BT771]|uniref:xanthine dehydrogenase molybdopterin binding subunit n=1 Tax=Flavitalea sp. BT771 TaxID=3063329 RepID=UPI0026E43FFB|nr:molybdopterin cofactor-binding domain-containing protein [Flavitalea sp. BT771]MDO6431896.1 molybdopterin-dependent oxidoreductase [Flavitalea sp. BT771]MDV6220805.1 molybdopterin cofactor-binding domain-containing protein [Flavitalea sp. BT771]